MKLRHLTAAIALAVASVSADAAVLRYTLQNVAFDDGGTASGWFDFKTDTALLTDYDVTTTGGSIYPGTHYLFATDEDHASASYGVAFVEDYQSGTALQLITSGVVALDAGTFALDLTSGYSYELTFVGGSMTSQRFLVSGSVTTDAQVPEPAMLGLFGLGALGMGVRRRRG